MKLLSIFKTTALLSVLGSALATIPAYAMDNGEEDKTTSLAKGMAAVRVTDGAVAQEDVDSQLSRRLAAFGLTREGSFDTSLPPKMVNDFLQKFDGIVHEYTIQFEDGNSTKIRLRPMLGGTPDKRDLVLALGAQNASQIPAVIKEQVDAIRPTVLFGTMQPLKWLFSFSTKEGAFEPAGFVYAKVKKPFSIGGIPLNTGNLERSSADGALEMQILASPSSLYATYGLHEIKPVIEAFFKEVTGRCGVQHDVKERMVPVSGDFTGAFMNTFVDNWDLMQAVTARFPLDDFQDPTNPSIVYSAELLWWRSGLPGDHQYDQYMGFGKTLLRRAKKELGELEITQADVAGVEGIYAGLIQTQAKALSAYASHRINPGRYPLNISGLTWIITQQEKATGRLNGPMVARMTGREDGEGVRFELLPSLGADLHQALATFFREELEKGIMKKK